MGNGASSMQQAGLKDLNKSHTELIRLMLPIYYDDSELTEAELELTTKTWKLILNDQSPEFLRLKSANKDFQYNKCVAFFFDNFYNRLFEMYPWSKDLFKRGMKSQGKFLVKMLSLALTEIKGMDKLQTTFIKLAEMHNEIGVKAIEYGIMGDVLFWTLKQCLGDVYTEEVHCGWIKIMSRMLKIMVPVAVAYELKHGSSVAQDNRRKQMKKAVGHETIYDAATTAARKTTSQGSLPKPSSENTPIHSAQNSPRHYSPRHIVQSTPKHVVLSRQASIAENKDLPADEEVANTIYDNSYDSRDHIHTGRRKSMSTKMLSKQPSIINTIKELQHDASKDNTIFDNSFDVRERVHTGKVSFSNKNSVRVRTSIDGEQHIIKTVSKEVANRRISPGISLDGSVANSRSGSPIMSRNGSPKQHDPSKDNTIFDNSHDAREHIHTGKRSFSGHAENHSPTNRKGIASGAFNGKISPGVSPEGSPSNSRSGSPVVSRKGSSNNNMLASKANINNLTVTIHQDQCALSTKSSSAEGRERSHHPEKDGEVRQQEPATNKKLPSASKH